jgi:rRNA maturation protein Nop10
LFFKRKAKEPELKPCPQCGEQIAASALDCPSCGLDLREAYHPAPDYARNTD